MEFIKSNFVFIFIAFVACMFFEPALCFTIIGSLIAYTGISAIAFIKKIRELGVNRWGKAVEPAADQQPGKAPLIEFTTYSGEIIRERPYLFSQIEWSGLKNNQKNLDKNIPIVYDPDDPKKFVLDNDAALNNSVYKILIVAGLLFVALSIAWVTGYINL